jgi:hypothetical protein
VKLDIRTLPIAALSLLVDNMLKMEAHDSFTKWLEDEIHRSIPGNACSESSRLGSCHLGLQFEAVHARQLNGDNDV